MIWSIWCAFNLLGPCGAGFLVACQASGKLTLICDLNKSKQYQQHGLEPARRLAGQFNRITRRQASELVKRSNLESASADIPRDLRLHACKKYCENPWQQATRYREFVCIQVQPTVFFKKKKKSTNGAPLHAWAQYGRRAPWESKQRSNLLVPRLDPAR